VGRDTVGSEPITLLDEDSGHERSSEREPKESKESQEAGDAGGDAEAWCEHSGEEAEDVEDEAHQVEDPAEAPHVVVVRGSRALSVAACEGRWDTRGAEPGISDWKGGNWGAAVLVVRPTVVEVSHLSEGSLSTLKRGGADLNEIGLVQGCGVGYTSENDEEHQDDGSGD